MPLARRRDDGAHVNRSGQIENVRAGVGDICLIPPRGRERGLARGLVAVPAVVHAHLVHGAEERVLLGRVVLVADRDVAVIWTHPVFSAAGCLDAVQVDLREVRRAVVDKVDDVPTSAHHSHRGIQRSVRSARVAVHRPVQRTLGDIPDHPAALCGRAEQEENLRGAHVRVERHVRADADDPVLREDVIVRAVHLIGYPAGVRVEHGRARRRGQGRRRGTE
mmetsp:Transcript_10174/g.41946  ORF Transcript_10174/g.41946 Transcript_10174/m.41946 type:complete len:221 (-) Transcript_10174:372-1034(-)